MALTVSNEKPSRVHEQNKRKTPLQNKFNKNI